MALAPLACIALLASHSYQEPQDNNAKLKLYDHIRHCTVKVYADFGDVRYHGSGVGFKRYGEFVMVITNSHVIEKDNGISSKISVKSYSRSGGDTMPAYDLFNVRGDKEYFDLAFLIVRDPDRKIDVADRTTNPRWKEGTVYACGHPHEEEFLVDHGKILPKETWSTQKVPWLVLHDALIEHGNSGGGLFDAEGKLAAINTWLMDGKIGMSIDLDVFTDFFDFRATTVSATSSEWVRDTTLPSDTAIFVLAVGKWKCRSDWGSYSATGYEPDPERGLLPQLNFGCLLVRMGDTTVPCNKGKWGPGKTSTVTYDDASSCSIKQGGGDVSFRINDKDLSDNSGELTVFYVIVRTPKDDGSPAK